jgi:hypothetical protein
LPKNIIQRPHPAPLPSPRGEELKKQEAPQNKVERPSARPCHARIVSSQQRNPHPRPGVSQGSDLSRARHPISAFHYDTPRGANDIHYRLVIRCPHLAPLPNTVTMRSLAAFLSSVKTKTPAEKTRRSLNSAHLKYSAPLEKDDRCRVTQATPQRYPSAEIGEKNRKSNRLRWRIPPSGGKVKASNKPLLTAGG